MNSSIVCFANSDSWNTLEWTHQLESHLAHLLQQLAAFGVVGAVQNRVELLHHGLVGTVCGKGRIWLILEVGSHQTVDVLDDERLAGVFTLEAVHLNVFDCTRLDLVAVALCVRRENAN